MNLRRLLASVLLPSILAAACSSPSATSTTVPNVAPGASASAVAASPLQSTAPTASEVARIAGNFDIGDGRTLYLECIGSGSPTILLEAGDGSTGASNWGRVLPGLVNETRSCTYDRAGLGRSSAATGCRQLDDILDDLDALLAAADVDGPYVLVGASGGGFLIGGFAARHPDDVAGMVFADAPKALTAALYPEVLPEIACDAPNNVERRDYLAVEHAVWDSRSELGDFPVSVLSNDYGDSVEPGTDEATNVADQRGWFDLTSGVTKQVVVTSGHDIPGDQPSLVTKEILAVLSAARSS